MEGEAFGAFIALEGMKFPDSVTTIASGTCYVRSALKCVKLTKMLVRTRRRINLSRHPM